MIVYLISCYVGISENEVIDTAAKEAANSGVIVIGIDIPISDYLRLRISNS